MVAVVRKVTSMKAMAAVVAVGAGERVNVSRVCAEVGVSRKSFYKWVARYRAEGLDGLEERSRRPNRTPGQTAAHTEELVVRLRKELADAGLDHGATTIQWHLGLRKAELEGWRVPSVATIHRILVRRGLVTRSPSKRPKSSWCRFEAPAPNEWWQIDAMGWVIATAAVEVFNVIDDHSRVAVRSRAVVSASGEQAWTTFSLPGDGPRRPRPAGRRGRQQHGSCPRDRPAHGLRVRPSGEPPAPPGHAARVRDRHAVEREPCVQSDRLPHRVGLGPRHGDRRRLHGPCRLRRRGGGRRRAPAPPRRGVRLPVARAVWGEPVGRRPVPYPAACRPQAWAAAAAVVVLDTSVDGSPGVTSLRPGGLRPDRRAAPSAGARFGGSHSTPVSSPAWRATPPPTSSHTPGRRCRIDPGRRPRLVKVLDGRG